MMEAWIRVEEWSDLGTILEVKVTGLDVEYKGGKKIKQQIHWAE